jgi:hypothetical protein
LAVQDTDKPTLCDRCFATLKPGMDYCPDCGAPVAKGPAAEGSDAAIYPELARANLLRMRGDYKAASDQCRSILRRFPNNASANVLLGDICVEQDDLAQAKEWYEMALDLTPDSVPTQHKLATVKHRIDHEAHKSVADQIGLPPHRAKSSWPIVATVLGILAVGAIAYVAGSKIEAGKGSPPIGSPIQAPDEPSEDAVAKPGGNRSTDQSSGTTPAASAPQEDLSLAQLISQRGPDGAHLATVQQDPRTGLLVLTYKVGEGENERAIGASLARTAFEQSPNTQIVTLRAMRDGKLVYVADARRDAYVETESTEWKQQNANDPDAWITRMLSQEWTPNAGSPDSPTSNQGPTGGQVGGPDSDNPNPPTGGGSPPNTTAGG